MNHSCMHVFVGCFVSQGIQMQITHALGSGLEVGFFFPKETPLLLNHCNADEPQNMLATLLGGHNQD